jgi:hypothetical protein
MEQVTTACTVCYGSGLDTAGQPCPFHHHRASHGVVAPFDHTKPPPGVRPDQHGCAAPLETYREAALADIDPKQNPERARFEDWYVMNAFDYARDPLGSQRCSLQWAAWKAALQSITYNGIG